MVKKQKNKKKQQPNKLKTIKPKVKQRIVGELQQLAVMAKSGFSLELDAAYRRLTETYPTSVDAHYQAAMYFKASGRSEIAIDLFKTLLLSDPDNTYALMELGVLVHRAAPAEALAYFNGVLAKAPNHADALEKSAYMLYQNLGDYNSARLRLEKALSIEPDRVVAYAYLADIARIESRTEDAIRHYKKVLSLNPDHGVAYYNLAVMNEFKGESAAEDIAKMEALYRSNKLDPHSQRHVAMGLGKVYDDLQEFDKSFQYYIESNKNRVVINNYTTDYPAYFKGFKDVFDHEFIDYLNTYSQPSDNMVFVLGMPRSGTTLVEQVLGSHSQVYGGGELVRLGNHFSAAGYNEQQKFPFYLKGAGPELVEELSRYLEYVATLVEEEKIVTDKTPQNFFYIGLIATLLPNAKIVHCKRNPLAICVSIFTNPFSDEHSYSASLEKLGEYYRCYQDLMDYWQKMFPNRIYDVDYEAMINKPEETIRDLLDYCELDFEEACLSFYESKRPVNTPSYWQVRKPIFKNSLDNWRRYENNLQPLYDALRVKKYE